MWGCLHVYRATLLFLSFSSTITTTTDRRKNIPSSCHILQFHLFISRDGPMMMRVPRTVLTRVGQSKTKMESFNAFPGKPTSNGSGSQGDAGSQAAGAPGVAAGGLPIPPPNGQGGGDVASGYPSNDSARQTLW